MKGRVFRVVIDDKGYDLMNAFRSASARDWAALIGATGRNPFLLSKRLGELERLAKLTVDERADLLAGDAGTHLMETISDLVFLARRMEGEREPGTDRPVTVETSAAQCPVIEALNAWAEAIMQRSAAGGDDEPDPT